MAQSMRQLNEITQQSSVSQLSESMKRLGEISQRSARPVQIPSLDPAVLRDIERPEVRLLREVHAELEGMAQLLSESGQQTAAMAEVTRANLTAINAVLGELQEGRKASARSDRRLFWLTVAVFVAAAVAAIVVVPNFIREIGAAVSWLRSLR